MASLEQIHAAHVRRLSALDPLVRPGELFLGDERHGRTHVRGTAAGLARVRETDRLWTTRTMHSLDLLSAVGVQPADVADVGDVGVGDVGVGDVGVVLDAWLDEVRAASMAGDLESSAVVSLASRDSVLVAPLVARHFGPATVLAVRDLDRPDPTAWSRVPDGVRVRQATPDDLDWLIERSARLHEWETRFGLVPQRSTVREAMGRDLPEALERDDGWTWIAELDGRAAAFVQVNPPQAASWVTPTTWLAPCGYVVGAFVEPRLRSAGLGRLLAATAHERARAEGWAALLLHHVAANPYSAPFWASMGYRPLMTNWMRRPVIGAR